MARPPTRSVETKLKIVLSAESSIAEVAPSGMGVSETSIGKWKGAVPSWGRESLQTESRQGKRTGRKEQLEAEVDDFTRALGEAHVGCERSS